jgi:hypothetical protein
VRFISKSKPRLSQLDLFPPGFLYCAMIGTSSWHRVLAGRLVLSLMLALVVGCAGKTIQYKEDHDRILRIDQAVESLRNAYVERDESAFESLLLPSGSLDDVLRDIRHDFDTFQDIQLEFAIERILIEGENVDVFVHWQGQWKRTPSEAGMRQRGHARLGWTGTQSILLRDAQGDLPFGMGSRASAGDVPARSRVNP